MTLKLENRKPINVDNVSSKTLEPEMSRKLGLPNRNVTMFFLIRISSTIKELTHECSSMLKDSNARVHKKFTGLEHIRKIGYIYGP